MSESDRPPSLDPARLADQAGWVRDLARRLVRDATDAEDLAQDVLLAGLEHPPHALDDRHLRSWLAGVARNLTLFRARGRGRRADRERTAARSAIAPGTDEVVARAQEVRRLVDAVLALEEPNKSAVLLAHLEGLSSRSIAKRLGTTPQNARKRVSRGLAQVRAKLAREDRAGPGDWLSGLHLVAHLPTPLFTNAASSAATFMSSKLLAASFVGALALFGFMTYLGSGSPAESPGLLPGASPTTEVDEELLEVGSTERGAVARRGTPPVGELAANAVAASVVITRHGSVRDAHDGQPIVGAELRVADAEAAYSDRVLAVTNSAGEFSIDDDGSLPEGFCVVHPGTLELHVERARMDSGAPLDLVVVGLGEVTVRASKEGGVPAAGERIDYSIDPIHGSDAQMWRWRRMVRAGETDADGVLQVDGLPVGTPVRLRFQNEWRGSVQTVIDPTLRRAEVELVRPAWSAVRMRLVDAAGAPAVGALVNWYGTSHRSGDGRSFQAGQDGVVTITDISAGHGGLVFPSLVHAPIELTVGPGETRDLGDIVLDSPMEVSGTLRAARGADLSALRVTVFQAQIAGGSVPVAADGAFRASAIDAPLTLVVTGRTLGWGPEYVFEAVVLARVDLVGPTTGVLIELQSGAGVLAARLPEGAGPAAVAYEVLALECEVDWHPPSPLLSVADFAPRERGLIATGPIEPGTYDLVVEHPVLGTGMAAGLTPSPDLDADLPEVVFGDGELVVELEDAEGSHRPRASFSCVTTPQSKPRVARAVA